LPEGDTTRYRIGFHERPSGLIPRRRSAPAPSTLCTSR
jgi:hypothetical protein